MKKKNIKKSTTPELSSVGILIVLGGYLGNDDWTNLWARIRYKSNSDQCTFITFAICLPIYLLSINHLIGFKSFCHPFSAGMAISPFFSL